jgi:molecular chaperone Hsp33
MLAVAASPDNTQQMTQKIMTQDPLGQGDDFVAAFQIEDTPVRGRIARLGEGTLDAILKRHDYPRWAANLLGEAVTLAVLVSSSLKVGGKIVVQAQGDGPVSLLVAEARVDGGVRGYLRLNKEKWDNLERINKGTRPHIPQVVGKGVMGIIFVPDDPDQTQYSGVVPLDGAYLEDCAQMYFAQSEQIPTRVRLAVGEISELGGTKSWRSGGALLQQVAGDDARGDTEDAWNTASILFDSVTDIELADPDLPSAALLFRLFNEQGVRLETPRQLEDKCTCSEGKLQQMLKGLPPAEVRTLAEDDGNVSADCQFCGRIYRFPVSSVLGEG